MRTSREKRKQHMFVAQRELFNRLMTRNIYGEKLQKNIFPTYVALATYNLARSVAIPTF
jgi:hypothetical protein